MMSGVNMSGELQNSRQSIPQGTLGPIAVSTLIYLTLLSHQLKELSGALRVDNVSMSQWIQKGSLNLALLMALRLFQAWKGPFNLISVVSRPGDQAIATHYIEELRDLCRLPKSAKTLVLVGNLEHCIRQAPQADTNFMGL